MIVRPSQILDFETLYQIDQACFPPGVSYSREELAKFIRHRNSQSWVAEAGEEIVGFVVAERQPRNLGHIITLDVVERQRRSGVGTALMSVAEDWAKRQDLRWVYLETAEDNRPAQRFYAARGYVQVDEIENYYSNARSAWVMAKRLK